VAKNRASADEQLRAISELDNYTIEKGDPDPRGWSVIGPDGERIGTVVDLLVDTAAMKVRQLVVDTAGDGSGSPRASMVAIDVDEVDVRNGSREVVARGFTRTGGEWRGGRAYQRSTTDEHEGATLTRSEEELRIGKREVSRGEARIGKHVEVEQVAEPVTRRREEVVIERRPVEAGARADASIGEDEVRIPLMEEEVVVDKRPVVKEELVVGKRVVEDHDTVRTEVRREEFDIDTPTEDTPGRRGGRDDR
jgi:uncharacterized protein (TIGR02271 family)